MDRGLSSAGQRHTRLELSSVPADALRPIALGAVHFARVNPSVEIGGFLCDMPTGGHVLGEARGTTVALDSRFFIPSGEYYDRRDKVLALIDGEGAGRDAVKFGFAGVVIHELEHVRHHQLAQEHGQRMPDILRANALLSESQRDAAAFPPQSRAPAMPWTVNSLFQAQPQLRLITAEIVEPVMGAGPAQSTVELAAEGANRLHQLGGSADRLSVVVTTAIVGGDQVAAIQGAAPGLASAATLLRRSPSASRDMSDRPRIALRSGPQSVARAGEPHVAAAQGGGGPAPGRHAATLPTVRQQPRAARTVQGSRERNPQIGR